VFGVSSQTLDALFRRARDRAGLAGFTFHDARRNAATRISKLVDPLMLCRIFGWRNPKMAMTYYAPSASEMAQYLDGRKLRR
jgi:integrase